MIDRRAFVTVLTLGGCASATQALSSTSDDPTLDQVLARNAAARGGVRALDAIHNTLNIAQVTEPGFTVTGRYIAADGRMRIDIFYNGHRAVSEGVDADGAWNWDGGKVAPQAESNAGAAALRHGIEFNLFGLHAFARRGHTLTLEGRETIGALNYYKIKVRLADGFETWRYINPTTWLIDHTRDVRPLHPDVDPTPVTIDTENTDFRAVAGVLTPFHWVQRNVGTGAEMQTGQIQRLEYNVPADMLNFARTATIIGL